MGHPQLNRYGDGTFLDPYILRVPHPCAFYAQGWDSTVADTIGILI
jgi:hypothetical protein